jgi:transcriptional regulator with XRE-family HTH domain
MARKPYRKSKQSQTRHFIKEWRTARGLTQERLAARIDTSAGNISMIENGRQGYTQAMLEAIAAALDTDAASLIMRNPLDPEGIWTVWEQIPSTDRARAIEVLKALTRTGTG